MRDTFIIQQDLSFWEYYKLCLRIYTYLKFMRILVLLVLAMGVLGRVLTTIAANEEYHIVFLFQDMLPAAAIVTFFVIAGFIISGIIYKTRSYLFKNISYEFTHWGITRHGEKTTFSKPWRDITRMKETKSFFIFYLGQLDVHFIQKKMIPDVNELAAFRAFVQQCMQG